MIHFFPERTVALSLLGLSIRWYGILYLASFFLAVFLMPRLQRYRHLQIARDEWLSIISLGFLGVIVGGRIGFVLFYEPVYYFRHPLEIVAVWTGGMSSHGGFIGVAVAMLWAFRRRPMTDALRVGDIVVVPAAIGLGIGRIGNMINQELYGTVTSLPWGVRIAGEEGLRHPVSLYELGANLLIACVCYWWLRRTRGSSPGGVLSLFLILYGPTRFALEYFRFHVYPMVLPGLFREQLLSIGLSIVGAALLLSLVWNERRAGVAPAGSRNR